MKWPLPLLMNRFPLGHHCTHAPRSPLDYSCYCCSSLIYLHQEFTANFWDLFPGPGCILCLLVFTPRPPNPPIDSCSALPGPRGPSAFGGLSWASVGHPSFLEGSPLTSDYKVITSSPTRRSSLLSEGGNFPILLPNEKFCPPLTPNFHSLLISCVFLHRKVLMIFVEETALSTELRIQILTPP